MVIIVRFGHTAPTTIYTFNSFYTFSSIFTSAMKANVILPLWSSTFIAGNISMFEFLFIVAGYRL